MITIPGCRPASRTRLVNIILKLKNSYFCKTATNIGFLLPPIMNISTRHHGEVVPGVVVAAGIPAGHQKSTNQRQQLPGAASTQITPDG